VFQLKEAVGVELIEAREQSFIKRAIARWSEEENLLVLGNHDAWRLSIVSFVVRDGEQYLHHNYVAALLNDLFGIQARSGCSCAGPYGHRLLGIDLERSKEFEREIVRGCEGVKPGWVRVNFNYFISEPVFEFILEAVSLIARYGYRLLVDYRFDAKTGIWHHVNGQSVPPLRLMDVSYRSGKLEYRSAHAREPEWALETHLEEARRALTRKSSGRLPRIDEPSLTRDFETLRWFPLPREVLARLAREEQNVDGAGAVAPGETAFDI
jgi:hypothetical protein